MGPAGGFYDPSRFVELIESRIAVGLQDARVTLQMLCRMFPFSIRRVGEPHRRSLFTARRPIVANICPQAARLGLSIARPAPVPAHRRRAISPRLTHTS